MAQDHDSITIETVLTADEHRELEQVFIEDGRFEVGFEIREIQASGGGADAPVFWSIILRLAKESAPHIKPFAVDATKALINNLVGGFVAVKVKEWAEKRNAVRKVEIEQGEPPILFDASGDKIVVGRSGSKTR